MGFLGFGHCSTKMEGTSDEGGLDLGWVYTSNKKEGRETEHSSSRGRDEDDNLIGEDKLQVACA